MQPRVELVNIWNSGERDKRGKIFLKKKKVFC